MTRHASKNEDIKAVHRRHRRCVFTGKRLAILVSMRRPPEELRMSVRCSRMLSTSVRAASLGASCSVFWIT